jgi:perosamine synthetase
MKIPLSRPDISEVETDLVLEVLKSPYLSMGPKLRQFEKIIAKFVGTEYAIAVSSGTAGLHLTVRSLGIGTGDEVITTPFSFIASSNCLLFEGATPVFVDIEPQNYNMDVNQIEEKITAKTKAILAVHIFGQPVDMPAVNMIADQHHLLVIEDACEALGTTIKGKQAGSFGKAAVFAFYPNKQITTGEGGIIVTNDPEIDRLCRSLRNQGRGDNSLWLEHVQLGFNYRMDELSAALGTGQMTRLEEIIQRRAAAANEYNRRLRTIEGVILPQAAPGVEVSWFVYVVRFVQGIQRDKVMSYLLNHGVECRPYFTPIHLQPFYRKKFGYKPGDFPCTEEISGSTLALPFYNRITPEEIEYVALTLEKAISLAR